MSKVVFVGNVPYNMSEDALIEVFKAAGPVVGFRLVFDRDTGKPRGYGFCEFADHETAMSAVRNLNGQDCGGRPLRIDLADSDPFLEGKTTVRGEIIDAGDGAPRRADPNSFLSTLAPGVPPPAGVSALDSISQTLATMAQPQLIEVLAQMKAFVITHPDQARALLSAHPQFAYALFQAMLLNKIVDPAVLQRMLAATRPPAPAASTPAPAPAPMPSYAQAHSGMPPSGQGYAPPMHMGPPGGMAAPPMQPQYPPMPPPSMPVANGFYGQPPRPPMPPVAGGPPMPPPHMRAPPMPPAALAPPAPTPVAPPPAPAAAPAITAEHQAMLMQVLSLTPEQIAAMPPVQQETIRQLKSQLMGAIA